MRTLVTGGGGFIGSHLVRRLLKEGHEVRVLDSFATGRRENLVDIADAIELVEGDVQSYERVHTAVRDCEVIFHQAALPSVPRSVQDPLTSNATNVIGTLNVLLAARDSSARRVLFASSSSVYGASPESPKHESIAAQPISPYAVAKLAGEGYCRSFFEVYSLETVALRYFNVFGPRQDPLSQYSAVIPKFMTAFLTGTRPTVFGDGHQTRDFTYIDNVIDANLRAMDCPGVGGRAFNVAYGEATSINAIIEALREITGRAVEPEFQAARPGEVRYSCADIGAAQSSLGWQPRVSVRDGLERTLRSYAADMAPVGEPAVP